MKSKTKIWLGVGAFVVAGAGSVPADATAASQMLRPEGGRFSDSGSDVDRLKSSTAIIVAQHRHGGEGGEGEGGEGGAQASLPPDLDFALKIAELRGHLLIGDELVKEGQWKAALPHFLHPTEEIYGDIRGRLKDYKTPPFEAALKVLANAVKARKGGDEYAKALKSVEEALAAVDAGLKAKQADWPSFTVETALELLKVSSSEYEEAIVKGRVKNPVEYQDARGFVWHAEMMIDSVAPELEKKDADALKHVREGFVELKTAFPSAMPPKSSVKDYGAVLGDVSRIELGAGKLM